MADGSTTLLYRFLGLDAGAGAQFDRMAARTAALGDTSKASAGKIGLLTKGVALTAAAVVVAGVKMAKDYQSSLTRLVTGAGESMKNLGGVQKSLLHQSVLLGVSANDLAKAMYPIESAGFHGAAGVKVLHAAVQGALADGASYYTVSDAVTTALNAYGLTANDATRVTDGLVAAVAHGKTTMEDLAASLGNVLPIAAALHVPLQQILGAMATMTYQGTDAAKASMYLRFAMGALANPTAKAKATLDSLGLSSKSLADVVAKHGLVAAFTLLQEAVGRKFPAGSAQYVAALANMVGGTRGMQAVLELTGSHLTSFAQQTAIVGKALHDTGSQVEGWGTYTKTFAYSWDKIKAEVGAAVIVIGEHLIPILSAAANWLGTELPKAVATIQSILKPFEQLVGGALTFAWKGLGDVLHVVGAVLGGIAHALEAMKGPLTAVAVAVAAMWLAFKAYKLAELGILAVRVAMVSLGDRARSVGASMAAAITPANVAMVGLTAAVAGAVYEWQKHKEIVAAWNAQTMADVSEVIGTLNKLTGGITNSTVAWVQNKLVVQGTLDELSKTGLSYDTITQAALGNAKALAQVNAVAKGIDPTHLSGYNAAVLFGVKSIDQLAAAVGGAQHQQRQLNVVQGTSTTTANGAARAQALLAGAAKQTTVSIKTLTTNLLALISAEISQMQTVDGFKAGLLQLRQQVKTNGDALGQNTLKGLANRDMLLGLLSSAKQAASGAKNVSGALLNNIRDFRNAASAAGFNKGAIDRLLTSLHLMPRQIVTKVTLDTSQISSALANLVPQMSAAGQQAAEAMKNTFMASMQIRSPSKVFQHYGRMLVQGLILGWKDGTASLKDALSTSVQAALERLTTVVANAIKRQQDMLKKAQGNLKSLLHQRAQDIGSLAGNIAGSADLGGLFGTDANGNPTMANADVFLTGQATTIANFAKDLKWGAAHHLSPVLLQEIANLGAVQGDQVLKQFMSGQASIATANAAEATIQKYSTGGATAVEDALYAKRVAKDRAVVRENTIELRILTRTLREELRKIGRQASLHMTIDAKTGRPVVDRKFIEDIIRGIRREQRIAGRLLLQ